jgi:hypothetical protein
MNNVDIPPADELPKPQNEPYIISALFVHFVDDYTTV